jgi:hypothetical protein
MQREPMIRRDARRQKTVWRGRNTRKKAGNSAFFEGGQANVRALFPGGLRPRGLQRQPKKPTLSRTDLASVAADLGNASAAFGKSWRLHMPVVELPRALGIYYLLYPRFHPTRCLNRRTKKGVRGTPFLFG